MTIDAWLKNSIQVLEKASISTARLDCLVLLGDTLNKPKSWILAHLDHKLNDHNLASLNNLLSQRKAHVPLAYIRSKSEFYGREFTVTPATLQPRPESETMIDLLKKLVQTKRLKSSCKILDVGTGSGAIGITAALELPKSSVELLDIDQKAIKVAKMNVDKFTLTINIIEGDLLNASSNKYDALLCNLPYVPDGYEINLAASHEPKIALFGGEDGLNLYRRLFEQIENKENRPLYILTESLPSQHRSLSVIAESYGYKLKESDDFIQVFKTNAY